MHSFTKWALKWSERWSLGHSVEPIEDRVVLISYPDDLPWSERVKQLCHWTAFQFSGGTKGERTNHKILFVLESERLKVLSQRTEQHAMIVSVGMIFRRQISTTTIQRWYDYEGFCRGHLVCKDGLQIHHQHIELNIDWWKELGQPDIFKRMEITHQSKDKIGGIEYKPLWCVADGMLIENFTEHERWCKAFYYPERQIQRAIDHFNDVVVSDLNTNTFYEENNEPFNFENDEVFDVIISPTSGDMAERLCEHTGHTGHVIIYDYLQENLDKRDVDIPFCTVEKRLIDIMTCDFEEEFGNLEGKILMNVSNIFGYHRVHTKYTYDEIQDQFDRMIEFFDGHFVRGSYPWKKWIRLR